MPRRRRPRASATSMTSCWPSWSCSRSTRGMPEPQYAKSQIGRIIVVKSHSLRWFRAGANLHTDCFGQRCSGSLGRRAGADSEAMLHRVLVRGYRYSPWRRGRGSLLPDGPGDDGQLPQVRGLLPGHGRAGRCVASRAAATTPSTCPCRRAWTTRATSSCSEPIMQKVRRACFQEARWEP